MHIKYNVICIYSTRRVLYYELHVFFPYILVDNGLDGFEWCAGKYLSGASINVKSKHNKYLTD